MESSGYGMPFQFCISDYPIADNCISNSSDGMQDSWRLGICNVQDSFLELSGSLEGPNLFENNNNVDAVQDFQDYMCAICEFMASASDSTSVSSESFSFKEDHLGEFPGHSRTPSIVTFRNLQEHYDPSEAKNVIPVRYTVQPRKKGTCYLCLKGNRFIEKESCIVCGAKYCCYCVLRAMGSMPEGRKCITCIGQRIDESKRKTLGKCSSVLKQLLTDLEVKMVMNGEKFCEVNQLPPELVFVNGESLSQSEISMLQTCPNPPTKLKPGRYWYDKLSGFWGKEGEKPCQIISPQMKVGGCMQEGASNGNTNIFINNREITKAELLHLQWVRVKCCEKMNYCLDADGYIQEEGMRSIIGNIWEKQRAKAICALLSLPTLPGFSRSSGDEVNTVTSNINQGTIGRKDLDSQFRILACFHSARNIPAIINLIEASRGTEKRQGLCVYAMHLMELSERSSAIHLVNKARKNGLPFWNKLQQSDTNKVIVAFEAFRQLSSVTMRPMTAISTLHDMHEDICYSAKRKRAAILIIPFHKHPAFDGTLLTTRCEFRLVNKRVLEHAPCSVGILVDRGLGGTTHASASNVSSAITVLFFGGRHDREALAYGERMAEHPGICLTVIHFKASPEIVGEIVRVDINDEVISSVESSDEKFLAAFKKRIADDNAINYEERLVNNSEETIAIVKEFSRCNLFLVGRLPEGPVAASLNAKTECPELGPVGNLLTSPDFTTLASVLVVQHYNSS